MNLFPHILMQMYNTVKGNSYPHDVQLLQRFGYQDKDIAQALGYTVKKVKDATKKK